MPGVGFIRERLLGLPPAELQAALDDRYRVVSPQLASPWAPTPDQLQSIVWADLVGADYAPLTRAAAMSVPAVQRMRNLLCGSIARMPLVDMIGDQEAPTQPPWMQRTDTDLPPFHRMLWTVDDQLFYGWSLWAAARGASSDGNPILQARRVPWHRWDFGSDSTILVDNEPVQAGQAILLPGPHEGILTLGAVALRQAADNLAAAANAARNPSAHIWLHYQGDKPLSPDEKATLVGDWAKARRGENGGVAYTNKMVEVKELGTHEGSLLIQGRNADAVDVARMGNMPAAMLDATAAGASLTYETTEGRNQQFLDYGAQLYMDAITARLSMDDVVPRGHRSAFDTSEFTSLTPTPTGAPTED